GRCGRSNCTRAILPFLPALPALPFPPALPALPFLPALPALPFPPALPALPTGARSVQHLRIGRRRFALVVVSTLALVLVLIGDAGRMMMRDAPLTILSKKQVRRDQRAVADRLVTRHVGGVPDD